MELLESHKDQDASKKVSQMITQRLNLSLQEGRMEPCGDLASQECHQESPTLPRFLLHYQHIDFHPWLCTFKVIQDIISLYIVSKYRKFALFGFT